MVFEKELNDLQARKAILLAECQLHRSLLDLEVAQVRGRLGVVRQGAAWFQTCRSYLPIIAPVAGFLIVRRWRTITRWGGRALVWKLIRGIARQAV